MGNPHPSMQMKPVALLVLGLALVCCGVSVELDSTEVQPMELGESSYSTAEATAEKGLFKVPGIPRWAKVGKVMLDLSQTDCRDACDGNKNCGGFQYIAAESKCRILERKKPRGKMVSLQKAKRMMKKAAKKAVKKTVKKMAKAEKAALKQQRLAIAPKKKKPSAGEKYREIKKKHEMRMKEYRSAR